MPIPLTPVTFLSLALRNPFSFGTFLVSFITKPCSLLPYLLHFLSRALVIRNPVPASTVLMAFTNPPPYPTHRPTPCAFFVAYNTKPLPPLEYFRLASRRPPAISHPLRFSWHVLVACIAIPLFSTPDFLMAFTTNPLCYPPTPAYFGMLLSLPKKLRNPLPTGMFLMAFTTKQPTSLFLSPPSPSHGYFSYTTNLFPCWNVFRRLRYCCCCCCCFCMIRFTKTRLIGGTGMLRCTAVVEHGVPTDRSREREAVEAGRDRGVQPPAG